MDVEGLARRELPGLSVVRGGHDERSWCSKGYLSLKGSSVGRGEEHDKNDSMR